MPSIMTIYALFSIIIILFAYTVRVLIKKNNKNRKSISKIYKRYCEILSLIYISFFSLLQQRKFNMQKRYCQGKMQIPLIFFIPLLDRYAFFQKFRNTSISRIKVLEKSANVTPRFSEIPSFPILDFFRISHITFILETVSPTTLPMSRLMRGHKAHAILARMVYQQKDQSIF